SSPSSEGGGRSMTRICFSFGNIATARMATSSMWGFVPTTKNLGTNVRAGTLGAARVAAPPGRSSSPAGGGAQGERQLGGRRQQARARVLLLHLRYAECVSSRDGVGQWSDAGAVGVERPVERRTRGPLDLGGGLVLGEARLELVVGAGGLFHRPVARAV